MKRFAQDSLDEEPVKATWIRAEPDDLGWTAAHWEKDLEQSSGPNLKQIKMLQ